MTPDQKAIAAPPRLTAVVMRSGDFEATISGSRLTLTRVGIRDGRTKLFDLDAAQAQSVLDLVAAGRHALEDMAPPK